jgi:uncharacterized membrane protein (UPF0127 family)
VDIRRDNWGKWALAVALIMVVGAGVMMIINVVQRKTMVSIGGQTVYAQVANTDQTRAQGLSGTSKLGDHEAMLFIFDVPSRWGMWMKDMKYNLDMVWMDRDKKIVSVAEDVSPDTYPKEFLPDSDALYVLELPAGFIARYHVATGQVVGLAGY